MYVYVYQHLCVYVCASLSECMPRHFSCVLVAVFHTSVSTFSEGSLQRAAKESFHTVAVILVPLNASLCPADYSEIKTCSLASQKFIMSAAVPKVFATEDVISWVFHGCVNSPSTVSDLPVPIDRHSHRVTAQTPG